MMASDTPRKTLFVDLDGTLVKTDTLWETLCASMVRQPIMTLEIIGTSFSKRHLLKQRLALLANIDVSVLPYDQAVLDFIQTRRVAGDRVILATAANEKIARAVAKHLGIFDDVIASNEFMNSKGANKLALIKKSTDDAPFDYVGDSYADLQIWQAAGCVHLANGNVRMEKLASKYVDESRIDVISRRASIVKALLSEVRCYQWIKNVLVFVPIFGAHDLFYPGLWVRSILGFVAMCCLASSAYIINDIADIESDRHHPIKRFRPIAFGDLPIGIALALVPLLIVLGLGVASLDGWKTLLVATLYLLSTLLYSFVMKKIIVLDVIVLAMLYTMRIFVGSVATGIVLSFWMAAFALFLFLGLAFLKRYSELQTVIGVSAHGRRGYLPGDDQIIRDFGVVSSFASLVMFSLYLNTQTVLEHYAAPNILWLLLPVMLYWICMLWIRAERGEIVGDPILYAGKRRESLISLLIFALVVIGATVG